MAARVLTWLRLACVTALILLAAYQGAGRFLMPRLLAGQIAGVEASLSRLLGAEVGIGELRGSWFRFGPVLEIRDLALAGEGVRHVLGSAVLSLDVPRSIAGRTPVVESIVATDLELGLVQGQDGRWSLEGLAGGGTDYTEQILDFFLRTENLALLESTLNLRLAGGRELHFNSLYLQLHNDPQRHDLQLQFRLNGQQSPSQLLVDISGDPRGDFAANLYTDLPTLDLTSLVTPGTLEGATVRELRLDGEFWLRLDQGGLRQAQARVRELDALVSNEGGDVALENAAFDLAAELLAQNSGWRLRLNGLALDLQQTPWDLPALQLELPYAGSAPLSVQAEALELGLLRQLATLLLPLPPNLTGVLDTLDPRGLLRKVHLETARDGSYPGEFQLRANLENVSVEDWNGAPAGRGLQGYLQTDAQGGFVELDSRDAEIHLPRLFSQAWHYDYLNTRVGWHIGADGFRVASDGVDVRNTGLLEGRVQFELLSSRNADGEALTELVLMIGVSDMDTALRGAYLPTLERVRPTMDWLQGALAGGRLENSGFILRTSTLGAAPGSTTFSSWFEVREGRLRFLQDWPELTGIDARVEVRDGEALVATREVSLAGMRLNPGMARVQAQAEGGALLTVRSTAGTGTDTGLAFLRNSPLRDYLGPFMDDWQASGVLDVKVALDLPLGGATNPEVIDVDVLSTGSELAIGAYALEINDINGHVFYRNDTGLSASALSARMFDFPLVADIATLDGEDGERTTRISGRGRAAVEALRNWPRQPVFIRDLLGYMSGEIEYTAELELLPLAASDGVRTRLTLASDLLGMDSTLPPPFGKNLNQAGNLQLALAFLENGQLLTARYRDLLSAELVLDDAGIERGQLYFGDLNRDFAIRQSDASTPGLLINGDLDSFDYERWREVADKLTVREDGGGRTLAEYLRLVDVNVGVLDIAGYTFSDINVQVSREGETWLLRGNNSLLSGRFMIPLEQTGPWQVDLDYLRFPPRAAPAEGEEVEEIDVLAAINPTELPAFDFTTAEISVGDQNLGAFSFQLRPHAGGATIADFRMLSPDATISDLRGDGGANVDWGYRQGRHTSSFNGVFAAGDLATVLPAWGHDANVESDTARFSGTLQWEGSPLAFTLRESSGQILLDINDGRFVDIESGSSRLTGALNVDALVRRLQLDFSDIFQRGFAFDRISGNLNFDMGLVTTIGDVLIEGPSSRININGEIDLARETIAADMQVRIPLEQNLSLLAGLLGGWPLALSTYVAGLIFTDQVADFATVIYRLEGPWDNPDAGFEAPEAP